MITELKIVTATLVVAGIIVSLLNLANRVSEGAMIANISARANADA